MPFRRRTFRRSRSGSRKRTRWLAVTPGGLAIPTFNTFQAAQVSIQDVNGAVPWATFTGGTVLRTLLDVTIDPILTTGAPPWDYGLETHVGVFMVNDVSPDSTTWDPNVPHGNFMSRIHASERVQMRPAVEGGSIIQWMTPSSRTMYFDIPVKRRILEGSRMWLSTRSFLAGTALISSNIGWTGRVLIQLP